MSFHLNSQSIAIGCCNEFADRRTPRTYYLFTSGNWRNIDSWCWIRNKASQPLEPFTLSSLGTRSVLQTKGRFPDFWPWQEGPICLTRFITIYPTFRSLKKRFCRFFHKEVQAKPGPSDAWAVNVR